MYKLKLYFSLFLIPPNLGTFKKNSVIILIISNNNTVKTLKLFYLLFYRQNKFNLVCKVYFWIFLWISVAKALGMCPHSHWTKFALWNVKWNQAFKKSDSAKVYYYTFTNTHCWIKRESFTFSQAFYVCRGRYLNFNQPNRKYPNILLQSNCLGLFLEMIYLSFKIGIRGLWDNKGQQYTLPGWGWPDLQSKEKIFEMFLGVNK